MGLRRQRQIFQDYGHNLGITRVGGSSWDLRGAGGWSLKMKVWPGWVSSEASLPGFADGRLLWCPENSSCVHTAGCRLLHQCLFPNIWVGLGRALPCGPQFLIPFFFIIFSYVYMCGYVYICEYSA